MNEISHLHRAIELLELPSDASLVKDLKTLTDRADRSNYQIAVFGPFNHGKSTLLNAILGSKTLPIDLIPTTGAAIRVVYGETLGTKITLTDGQIISAPNTDILSEFAILDNDRRMRGDVREVEVAFPHPFLATGVELIDLPGTNDREEQDKLVCDRLLAADLIIHVLDVRKLMTLGEREHLRDWLENRGIHTVIFVANFTNTLEPTEQKEVQHRLRFVAESFRSQLPAGISNLYRVDALPALRARIKGDDSILHTSGLPTFISALQSIVSQQQQDLGSVRQPVLHTIASEIRTLLQQQVDNLTTEINEVNNKRDREAKLKQQAQHLIKTGWETSLKEIERWLYLPNLISFYQTILSDAIRTGTFDGWEASNVRPRLQSSQQEINDWVTKAKGFFNTPDVAPLTINTPAPPDPILPTSPPPNSTNTSKSSLENLTPTAVATGLGWILGGPIGAVVAGSATTIASKISGDSPNEKRPTPPVDNVAEISAAYIDAAADYLMRLNTETMAKIKDYRQQAIVAIEPNMQIDRSPHPQQLKLDRLQDCLTQIQRGL